MKKILLGAMATIAVTAPAPAADLPARTYTKAAVMAPPVVYNWTGCYLGGNIGGGWAKTQQTRIGLVNGIVFPAQDYGSASGSSFIGGGQIGCDYQFGGNWVVGAQGMFDFGNVNSSHTLPLFQAYSSMDRAKNIYTATARLGYLFAPQVLAYVKGGGAWTGTDTTLTTQALLYQNSLGNNRSGWTVGGGLEWMFAPGWSVFGEYDYMDFGTKNIAYVPGPLSPQGVPGDLISTRLTAETLLFGVNYKFNFGGQVVAKY
jgi:outer membrane immunogenic protein